jgi:hypothetical protein
MQRGGKYRTMVEQQIHMTLGNIRHEPKVSTAAG